MARFVNFARYGASEVSFEVSQRIGRRVPDDHFRCRRCEILLWTIEGKVARLNSGNQALSNRSQVHATDGRVYVTVRA